MYVTRHYMFPWLLSLLIPLKFKNLNLYRQFIQHECHASNIMDYIDETISLPVLDHNLDIALNAMETDLYLAESKHLEGTGAPTPWQQLELLHEGSELTNAHLLSKRTKASGHDRIGNLLGRMVSDYSARFPSNVLDYLAELMDIHRFVRR